MKKEKMMKSKSKANLVDVEVGWVDGSAGTTVQGDDDKSEGDTGEGDSRGVATMVAGRWWLNDSGNRSVVLRSVLQQAAMADKA
ncbi:hypothetical protein Dimus_004992 [Dionaea muscipula]